MLVVTAEQMKQIENSAIEYDITLPRLMENAGSAVAAFIRRMFPVNSLNCVVFCGSGNNGGEGFVVARRLSENGAKVVVVLVDGHPQTEQSAQMLDALKTFEIPILSLDESRALIESYAKHADLLVDAIYGTGFNDHRLPTIALIACQIMNEAPAAIVSIDIPSGITCDRGRITFGSVKADFTVVLQILKPLHVLPVSMEYCGDIQIAEIGIPEELFNTVNSHFSFIEEENIWKSLPVRKNESHKGDFGNLLVICGSNNYRGAGILAVSAALRVGVGSCTLAAPEVVCNSLINHMPEAMVQPLPVCNNVVEFEKAITLLEPLIKKADAVLFGCGYGVNPSTFSFLDYLLNHLEVTLILDADALTLLSEHLDLLKNTKCSVILTPHPGEMASLDGITTNTVQENRLTTALDFATKHEVTVVLKGHGTLIALKNGKILINETGNAGLAKSGAGDLLAGMIAGFSAQDMSAEDACAAGVWLHGSAGDRCSKRLSVRSMLPSDIFTDLASIFAEQENANNIIID